MLDLLLMNEIMNVHRNLSVVSKRIVVDKTKTNDNTEQIDLNTKPRGLLAQFS